ncbi:MAG TPA: hypothetical protein VLL25_15130 [Acidimicrobiales bacterium]|nr:hypothetical protein [Acidimicrobiales bacterium]
MSEISRKEFDDLAGRVTALEHSLATVAQLIAERMVPYLDHIDAKLDAVDVKIDEYAAQVNAAMRSFDQYAARHERFVTAIADHFGIDLTTDG